MKKLFIIPLAALAISCGGKSDEAKKIEADIEARRKSLEHMETPRYKDSLLLRYNWGQLYTDRGFSKAEVDRKVDSIIQEVYNPK